MSATAMNHTLPFTPANFAAYLGYDIVRGGDEHELGGISQFLS